MKSKWSRKYDKCINCNSSKINHVAKGLCRKCYMTQATDVLCACGCGKPVTRNGNVVHKYRKGHWMKNNDAFMDAHIKAFTGENNPHFGKFGKDHPAYGHKTTNKTREERRQRRLNALASPCNSPTDIEAILSSFLDDLNISHISQHKMYKKFVVDEYLPEFDIIIEALGTYWHGDIRVYPSLSEEQKKIRKRDLSRAKYLNVCGHRVLFLWGKDIKENREWCKDEIISAIENQLIPQLQDSIQRESF